MELDKRILDIALRGVNDLEMNLKGSFKIDDLNGSEITRLVSTYLSNYSWEQEKNGNLYNLIVSKLKMNQRR